MSDQLVVLVPVLGRPHRVTPLLDAIEATTPGCRVVFLADHDDIDECAAIMAQPERSLDIRLDTAASGKGYAAKINWGVRRTSEPLIFTAADDLEPQQNWFDFACNALEQFDVAGLNDLIPRRRRRAEHATHFLMTRVYAERPAIDGSEGPMYTGYGHEKVDDELIASARHRGAYVYVAEAHVKHLHPDVGTAEWDETYEKGRATRVADRELFYERERLWA